MTARPISMAAIRRRMDTRRSCTYSLANSRRVRFSSARYLSQQSSRRLTSTGIGCAEEAGSGAFRGSFFTDRPRGGRLENILDAGDQFSVNGRLGAVCVDHVKSKICSQFGKGALDAALVADKVLIHV